MSQETSSQDRLVLINHLIKTLSFVKNPDQVGEDALQKNATLLEELHFERHLLESGSNKKPDDYARSYIKTQHLTVSNEAIREYDLQPGQIRMARIVFNRNLNSFTGADHGFVIWKPNASTSTSVIV